MKRWIAVLLSLLLVFCLVPAVSSAADDVAGLAYSVAVETFDTSDTAKSEFTVGETVVVKVMLRSTGSAAAPVYALQGKLTYGAGLSYQSSEPLSGGSAQQLSAANELSFAAVSTAGLSLTYPCPLLTVSFRAAADGKPLFRLSEVIVANSDATERNVSVTAEKQILVGTGVRAATPAALRDDVQLAQALLNSAIVSDTPISANYPEFRVTQQVYQQLQQQIQSAQAVLSAASAPGTPELQAALNDLQAAVDLFNANKIYNTRQRPSSSSSAGELPLQTEEVAVELTGGEGGAVSFAAGELATVIKGTSLTITALPDPGNDVLSIYINGQRFPGQKSYTIPNVDFATKIHVEFCPALPFTDVAEGSWYYDAVRYAWAKGLFSGISESLFGPELSTTRGMIVTLLYRMEGEPAVTGPGPFDDVAAGQWYTAAVLWAADHEIVGGYGNGSFGPGDSITREQMAAILWRYAKHKDYNVASAADLSVFADASSISSYAKPALAWANAEGLVSGKGAGLLDPRGQATRAQSAAILQRFCENYEIEL